MREWQDAKAVFTLAELDTTDGPVRLLVGEDGIFTDKSGARWYGSSAIKVSRLRAANNGVAPAGQISFAYFAPTDGPDLIDQLKERGLAMIEGRSITFFVQRFFAVCEFHAPVEAPIQLARRVMRSFKVGHQGPTGRMITVGFESWAEDRSAARRIILNADGHARLIGQPNPSLSLMPTTLPVRETLF